MVTTCAAARGGSASLSTGPFGLVRMDLSFLGSGSAELEQDTELWALRADEVLSMVWRTNGFVGYHWLLGKFKIELDDERTSIGSLRPVESLDGLATAVNTNAFYFTYAFPRLGGLRSRNEQAIVNRAQVYAMPPTEESMYTLADESKTVGALIGKRRTPMNFNYCTIAAYPKRNIGIEVLGQELRDDGQYRVLVK